MTPTEESRLLGSVLKRIESGSQVARQARWLSIVVWLALVAGFMVLFQIAPRFGVMIYLVVGVSCILGVLTAFMLLYSQSVKHWPILAPYIKVDEVKRRLDELKPGN